jgi:hypothetical protein
MIICNLAVVVADTTRISATIEWEDQPYPQQVLEFEVSDAETTVKSSLDERCADAFLAACFPLAALHGESRVRTEEKPCPMLVEGLQTAHAWWVSWGGMYPHPPKIETPPRGRDGNLTTPRRAISCLSGGVDGLHTLLHTDGYTVRVIRLTSTKRFLFTASTSENDRATPKMSAFEWCWSTFSR